jgi:hypothetical protein
MRADAVVERARIVRQRAAARSKVLCPMPDTGCAVVSWFDGAGPIVASPCAENRCPLFRAML